MYRKMVNDLRGRTVLEVRSAAPERVVNLCAANGVPFWDVDWRSGDTLRLTTTRTGERRLRALAGELAAEIHIVRRGGLPEIWRRVRRRYVLLIAAVLLPVALAVGGGFIWTFEISGANTVPEEQILQALERCDVKIGTRGVGLDQDALRNRVLPLLPDVVYLAVNVRGCTARVQVVERTRPPHLYSDRDKQNLVAAKSGLVTEVRALDGVAFVKAGDTVQAGQMLISGVADSPRGARYLRATGTVTARTWYTLTVSVPLRETEGAEGGKTTSFAVTIGRRRIKIFEKGSALPMDCAKIVERTAPPRLFGLSLPVTWTRETVTSLPAVPREEVLAAAKTEGETQLLRQLTAAIGEGGQVVKSDFTCREEGDYLRVTLQAECVEDIAQAVPIQ